MAKALSWLCLLACLGCLVVFFWFRQESKDEGNTKTDRWTLGLPSSPWLVSTSEERTNEENKGGETVRLTKQFSWNRHLEFLSASWLFLLGAVVFWSLFSSLRARPSPPKADTHRP
jgi:hypothetical protein